MNKHLFLPLLLLLPCIPPFSRSRSTEQPLALCPLPTSYCKLAITHAIALNNHLLLPLLLLSLRMK